MRLLARSRAAADLRDWRPSDLLDAGWCLRYCAVGVGAPVEGITVTGISDQSDPPILPEITIHLERKPKVNIPVADVSRFVRAGTTVVGLGQRSHEIALPPNLPYSWLTVGARGRIAVDSAAESAFLQNPAGVAPRISHAYRLDVRSRFRPVARLGAALTGAWLNQAVLIPWVEQERYWFADEQFQGFSEGAHGNRSML